MAGQTMNMEMIPKLKNSIEKIDELVANLKKGYDGTLEICEESGSPKLIASCKAAGNGVESLVVTAKELQETLQMLLKQYEKLEAAL